jgi:hypothetical protein
MLGHSEPQSQKASTSEITKRNAENFKKANFEFVKLMDGFRHIPI